MNYTKQNYTHENTLSTNAFDKYKHQPSKPIARMRGIREAIAILKQTDFNTAMTYGFIRKLCDNGQLKSIQAGRKILINLDELLNFLSKEAN